MSAQPLSAGPATSEVASALVVSPFEKDRAALRSILEGLGWRLEEAPGIGKAVEKLKSGRIGVVLCEHELPVGNWTDLLFALRMLPDPPCLIVCARLADVHFWIDVLELGGFDVLATPFRPKEVESVVLSAWRRWSVQRKKRSTAARGWEPSLTDWEQILLRALVQERKPCQPEETIRNHAKPKVDRGRKDPHEDRAELQRVLGMKLIW